MKVLLIDFYSDIKLSREEFHIFYGILHNIIQTENNLNINEIEIITKKYYQLDEYIVDWEYSSLLSNSLNNSKNFDLIDIVCISGDLKILPWNKNCYQLITLIHMCNMLNKPLLTCGSGSHIAIYTCATQGIRYQILNLPIGDKIENIKTQSTYFKGPNGYPCGWLDHETGDIYTYDHHLHHWNPVCNIGMYRIAQTGTPTPARFRPIKKKFEMEDRIAPSHIPDTPGDHDGLLVIRKNQHKFYGFNSFQSFTLSFHLMDDWQFNVDGALPLHTGLEILADGPHGPAVFKHSTYSLHIGSRVTTHYICEDIRMIIRNYFRYIFQQFRKLNTLGKSCYQFLYVEHNGGLNEAEKLSKSQSPPLSSIPIRTKIKGGPKLISSPVTEIYETQVFPTADVSHIIGPPKIGTIRQYKQQFRDPYRMKHVRLQQVFETCYGQNKCKELNHLAKSSSKKQNNNDNDNNNNNDNDNDNNNDNQENDNEYQYEYDQNQERERENSNEKRNNLKEINSENKLPLTSSSRIDSPLLQLNNKSQYDNDQQEYRFVSSPKSTHVNKNNNNNNNNHNNNINNNNNNNQKYTIKQLNQNTKNIRYVAYNRTMIAEENIRRQQYELKQSKNPSSPSKRMNWKSDWKAVRGVDKNFKHISYDDYDYIDDNDNNDNDREIYNNNDIDKEKYPQTMLTLEDEARLSYIPMIHPLTRPSTVGNIKSTSYNNNHNNSSHNNSRTSISNNENPPKPVTITRIRPKSAVGSSSWLQHQNQNENQTNQYEGIFRGGYLTPYEKERKEYMKAKGKFISGTFKTYSGIASEIPLRDSGGIIFDGPYPAPIDSDKEITKVGYYGAWKPTKDLYSHQPSELFDKNNDH